MTGRLWRMPHGAWRSKRDYALQPPERFCQYEDFQSYMKTKTEMRLFSPELLQKNRSCFFYIDEDPVKKRRRLLFDNAGGSYRLKAASKAFIETDAIPDCPERMHDTAMYLNRIMQEGEKDIRAILNATKGGQIFIRHTASQLIWEMIGVIVENLPGNNVVTSKLEHPCVYDACRFFTAKTGKKLRSADTNAATGGVDVEAIAKLVDKDTCLLSVIFASNISGAILDISNIVKAARAIKPDLHIVVDAVQHAPHGLLDVDALDLDGIVFAPYKFFGVRGAGIGYASERVSLLPHTHLYGKDENGVTWAMGSPAPAHYAAITKIVDYVCGMGANISTASDRRELFAAGMNAIMLHERALMHHALEGDEEHPGLRHIKGVHVLLDNPDLTRRDFILAISLDNWGYTEAVREYEKRGFIVYERVASSIYSGRMLKSFAIDGCIRISPLHCHSIAEINEFLTITATMVADRMR